ncbi:MAG TPA: adenylate/guanylate cyclase domain-containing protein [Burkholderiaceae bacterium]|nr:adenylate/guanylate cyclase domain-containing protein [Burkholderiaceae bacterium]
MTISPDPTPEPIDWPELSRQRRAIVVVDVVESVRLMQANEADVIDRWRRFVNEVRTQVLPAHGGRLVKSLGDGLLLEFGTVPAAVAASLDVQRRIMPFNVGRDANAVMGLRIGVHVAEVVVDALDIYGAGVNLAARLADLAAPGEIAASAEARDALAEGVDADLHDLGECFLRRIDEPVRAYRIETPDSDRSFLALSDKPPDLTPTVAFIPPLPLDSSNANPGLGELIADGVIGRLSRNALLKVISRLSSSALKGRGLAAGEIGKLLDAAYVLSGSYTVGNQRIVVDLELCDTRSGVAVWGDRLAAPLADLIETDSVLIGAAADAVSHHVVEHALKGAMQRSLPTLSSYAVYLGALSLMHRASRTEFERAKELLDHLIDRHRRVPTPRAWLAQWYVLRLTRGWSREAASDVGLAMNQAQRAIDLDSSCGLAYAMAGFVQCHLKQDLEAADELYGQALDANPNEAIAWLFKGVLHTFKGEGPAALEASDRALSLSPLDPLRYYYYSLAASAAVAAGNYGRAIDLATRSLRSNRTHTSTYRALAMAQALSGREQEARATATQLLVLEPDFTVSGFLRRSPSGRTAAGALYADALRVAGVPE